MRLEYNEVLMSGCTDPERQAWERLDDGPLDLDRLAENDRALARGVARLQRKGLVIYSGFTPSDAAHVLGLSGHWNASAARLAALIWARQMRHVYGLGRWRENDAETPSRHVMDTVSQRISRALIEAGLHQHRALDAADAKNLTGMLAGLVYESSDAPGRVLDLGSLFHLRFAADYPVVAVGAPAATFFPDAAAHLGVELLLPEHAEVANAFGAVMGSVMQRASVTVTQPLHGQFIVHGDAGPVSFATLDDAVSSAQDIATRNATQQAREAGAKSVVVRIRLDETRVQHDVDGDLFLETRVTAVATGRPDLSKTPI
jgi:N-methylhydantoinase A/oxoprolinase/acetone carboxylase beta subunit